VRKAHALVEAAFAQRGKKLLGLVDLTEYTGTFSTKALPVLSGYMKANKQFIEKTAGFGAGRTTTLAANVITSLAGRGDISFFKTREEALTWLLKA
jgi:hypothetical protein